MRLSTVSELDLGVSKLGRFMQEGQRAVLPGFLTTAERSYPGRWLYSASDELGVFQLLRG